MKLLKDRYKLLEKTDEDEKVVKFLGQTVTEPVASVDILTLKKRWMQNPEFVQRYTQEYHSMASLDSPLFLKVYDIDFSNNLFFVATEHIEGRTIHDMLIMRDRLSLAQIINIVTQVARALGHAMRENIKHRALTYSDIVLTEAGKVKITQFRIPRNVTSSFDSDAASGKPLPVPGQSSDIFFAGSLFYELLTFEPLASVASVRQIKAPKDFTITVRNAGGMKPVQTEGVKEIIYRCVTAEISARYQTIDELLAALVKFVQEQVNKTDVLTTMQVDPARFAKDEKKAAQREPVAPPQILPGALGKAQPPEGKPASSKVSALPQQPAAHDDPYAILFGKAPLTAKPTRGESAAAKAPPAASRTSPASPSQPALDGSAAPAHEEAGLDDGDEMPAKAPAAVQEPSDPGATSIWKNRKSGKSLFAKIANFWYTMMLAITSFLCFVLYIFW